MGILLTLRILKLASLIINKGVGLDQIALVFLSIIPAFLEIALPLAALLGIMLAFARLSGDSEIVVLRASGVSLHQLVRPIAILSVALMLFGALVSFQLRPWGYKNLSQALFSIASSKGTAGLTAGVFNKLGDLILYSEKIDHSTGRLTKVIIDDKRDGSNRQIVLANTGQIVSNTEKQTLTLNLFDGTIHEITPEDKYVLTQYVQNSIVLESEQLHGDSKRRRRSRELRLPELQEQLAFYNDVLKKRDPEYKTEHEITIETPDGIKDFTRPKLKKQINGLKVEIARKFTMPFAAVVLAMIAIPLGVQPPRTQRAWGLSLSAVLALIVFVLYYGLLSLFIALGEGGKLTPYVGLWFPNLITLGIAYVMLRKMSNESWQSVAEAVAEKLDAVISRCKRIFNRRRSKAES